jgi:pimeloyl-ACP methyl ester carboxylesterase
MPQEILETIAEVALARDMHEVTRAKVISMLSELHMAGLNKTGRPDSESQAESPAAKVGYTADPSDHVVVLIHGIRTWAPWYRAIAKQLKDEGFDVETTNYGRLDLVRFLLPVPWFRNHAVKTVSRDLDDIFNAHRGKKVSVIAHSFGTYIISRILAENVHMRFYRVIFCGGIVPNQFRPASYPDRLSWPLLNEVGTRDIWPVLAESITWGYGATGARGVQRPRSFDRYHRGVGHSAFLNATFCRDWWIPFLRGQSPEPADIESSPSWWLDLLLMIKVKYLLLVSGLALYANELKTTVVLEMIAREPF